MGDDVKVGDSVRIIKGDRIGEVGAVSNVTPLAIILDSGVLLGRQARGFWWERVDDMCPGCAADPQPEDFGSPRACAFPGGVFNGDNWACVSMAPIRDAAYEVEVRCEDSHMSILPFFDEDGCGGFIVVSYYKHRGRTSTADVYVEGEKTRPLTLADAQRFAAQRAERRTE